MKDKQKLEQYAENVKFDEKYRRRIYSLLNDGVRETFSHYWFFVDVIDFASCYQQSFVKNGPKVLILNNHAEISLYWQHHVIWTVRLRDTTFWIFRYFYPQLGIYVCPSVEFPSI